MSMQAVKDFFSRMLEDSNIQKELIQALEDYKNINKPLTDDERTELLITKLIPIANKYGFDFTIEEIERIKCESLSDSELKSINGSGIGAGLEKFFCCKSGF